MKVSYADDHYPATLLHELGAIATDADRDFYGVPRLIKSNRTMLKKAERKVSMDVIKLCREKLSIPVINEIFRVFMNKKTSAFEKNLLGTTILKYGLGNPDRVVALYNKVTNDNRSVTVVEAGKQEAEQKQIEERAINGVNVLGEMDPELRAKYLAEFHTTMATVMAPRPLLEHEEGVADEFVTREDDPDTVDVTEESRKLQEPSEPAKKVGSIRFH